MVQNLDDAKISPPEHLEDQPGDESGGAAKPALDILSRLVVACKSRLLYSPEHPAVKDAVTVLHAVIEDSLNNLPEIAVRVEKERFVCGDQPLGEERESLRQLASRIRSLNIRAIVFSAGISLNEVEALVELVVSPPEALEKEGGAEAFLLSRGVHGIRVVESEARRAEEDAVDSEGETPVAEAEKEEEALAEEDEFQKLLDLLFNPEKLALALARLRDTDGNPLEGDGLAAAVFAFLREAWASVEERTPERIPALARAFAETLLFLENDLRNRLFLRHILPGLREEPLCQEILGRFSPQEAAAIFSHFLPLAPELIPRVDTLFGIIGFREKDIDEALQALRDRLIDLGEVPLPLISTLDAILAGRGIPTTGTVLPSPNEVSSLSEVYQDHEMEEIRRISEMDLSLETHLSSTPMLLDLLRRGSELDNLGKVVDLLVENFWGLVTSAQFALAASILDGFCQALQDGNPAILPHRQELEHLLEEASQKSILQRVIQLACERRGDPEAVEGFKQFMNRLGDRGLLVMIDALGSEERMSVRKFIIDNLADLARDRISLLASFLDDPRWYLVRNIVTVMSRLRSPFTFPYLERALQHHHPKVRAEAIRAVGLTGGYEAGSLLIKGLRNPDERTRILCIRWLGRLEVTRATPRLVAMLEEKEPGGESLSVKKEILESLGKIKDPETYEVLRKYAGRQRIFFKSEWQELSIVAQEALQSLLEKYPHLARKK